jgi:hypothetical protein
MAKYTVVGTWIVMPAFGLKATPPRFIKSQGDFI